MTNGRILIAAVALAVASSPLTLTGCGEGTGEKIGQKIDGNDSTVKDKLTPDKDGEKAGKKIDKAVDDATR